MPTTAEQLTEAPSDSLLINPGPLDGVGSLYINMVPGLKAFSARYMDGQQPKVTWDLRHLESKHISMATLVAFLATAHRLRRFTQTAPTALFSWKPAVFGFLDDVSFFSIAELHDVLTLPHAMLGGYERGKTNPHSGILVFPLGSVPVKQEFAQWTSWKDQAREAVTLALEERTQRIFFTRNKRRQVPSSLKDAVWLATAELVVNAMLWGESSAFVALQRTGPRITVAVADAGRGFLETMNERFSSEGRRPLLNSVEALLAGSLITKREFGLRRVIDAVVSRSGSAVLSSDDGQITWRRHLWGRFQEGGDDIETSIRKLGPPATRGIPHWVRDEGFSRLWRSGLRGSRVTFEIPLPSQAL